MEDKVYYGFVDTDGTYYHEYMESDHFTIMQTGILDEVYDEKFATEIEIPPYISVISPHALAGIEFKSVKIPSEVVSIGCSAFENCENLLAVYIPDSVLEMGSCCFRGCTSLKKVYAGAHIIGTDSFSDCICLKKACIGSRTRLISKNAFYHCNQLEDVIITGNDIAIKNDAFCGCESLQNIYIHAAPNVDIAEDAFYGCPNIKSVTIYGSLEYAAKIVEYFKGINPDISIDFLTIKEGRILIQKVFGAILNSEDGLYKVLDLSDVSKLEEDTKIRTRKM